MIKHKTKTTEITILRHPISIHLSPKYVLAEQVDFSRISGGITGIQILRGTLERISNGNPEKYAV